jgi:peptide chain release factor 1
LPAFLYLAAAPLVHPFTLKAAAMLKKLEEVEQRFEELNRKLADPEVLGDPRRLRDISKEHSELSVVVEVYRQLKKVDVERSASQQMLGSEKDPELVALAKEEIAVLDRRRAELDERLKILLLPRDPNDAKNIILEIRSGTGGDEASLFAGELFRMYARYAEGRAWKVEVVSSSPGARGGFKEVVAMISGQEVYSGLKYEAGVHRVQRVPETEAQGRIHTSAVTVAVLPEAEEVDVDIQDKDLRIDVFRSGGPGGQSVNTTDSAVRITHLPTGQVVICQDEKSQIKNKSKALKILRARLLDQKRAEQDAKLAAERRAMVKSGDRSDKVRTYNFPQDRLTDHRIGLTVHNLASIMDGDLGHVIIALRTHYQAEALRAGGFSQKSA